MVELLFGYTTPVSLESHKVMRQEIKPSAPVRTGIALASLTKIGNEGIIAMRGEVFVPKRR